jgi:hypothetical protein
LYSSSNIYDIYAKERANTFRIIREGTSRTRASGVKIESEFLRTGNFSLIIRQRDLLKGRKRFKDLGVDGRIMT